MATCRGCCKMGYPLQGGYCTGCRGDCGGGLGCRSDRERGWNPSNRIMYKDPPPLLGDMQFPMQERLRRDFPHRRMPETLCDCEKCKSLLEIRRDGSLSPTTGHTPGGCQQPKRIGYSSPTGNGPTPTKSSMLRSRTSQEKHVRGGGNRPPLTYGSPYSYDPAKYSNERSLSPNYEKDGTEEVAYQKLWAAFHTIRGAVIEQQQHEAELEERFTRTSPHYNTPGKPSNQISEPYSRFA